MEMVVAGEVGEMKLKYISDSPKEITRCGTPSQPLKSGPSIRQAVRPRGRQEEGPTRTLVTRAFWCSVAVTSKDPNQDRTRNYPQFQPSLYGTVRATVAAEHPT